MSGTSSNDEARDQLLLVDVGYISPCHHRTIAKLHIAPEAKTKITVCTYWPLIYCYRERYVLESIEKCVFDPLSCRIVASARKGDHFSGLPWAYYVLSFSPLHLSPPINQTSFVFFSSSTTTTCRQNAFILRTEPCNASISHRNTITD